MPSVCTDNPNHQIPSHTITSINAADASELQLSTRPRTTLLELAESGIRNQLTSALRPLSEDLTIKSLLFMLLNLHGKAARAKLDDSQRDPLPSLSLPTSHFQHLQQSIVHSRSLIRLPNAYSHCSEEELWLLHFSRPHQHTRWGGGAMAEPTI